jgi:NTE family protein
MVSRPDILVLGGGGVLGEAWMTGVLAGVEDAAGWDLRRCEYFVGTSAGSIVAADLAAGRRPRRPSSRRAGEPGAAGAGPAALSLGEQAAAWLLALGSPLAPASLSLMAPGGAMARAALLRALPRPTGTLAELRRHVEASKVGFDGRLRIAAVRRDNGRRVVFGRPSSPRARVGEAVEASCTVPWLFAPVTIGGLEYVDGGVWSPTNLDAAPAGRGSFVLCLNPTAGLTGLGPLSLLTRGSSRTLMALEAAALRARGARVVTVGPDAGSVAAIGRNLMAHAPRSRVHAAGYAQGLRLDRDPRLRLDRPRRLGGSAQPGAGSTAR